ncbi:MAG: hypothetical protein ACLP5V_08320 [Candidatus Bathyarchaeia archaeon]
MNSEDQIIETFMRRIRDSDSIADDLLSTVQSQATMISSLVQGNAKLLDVVRIMRGENVALRAELDEEKKAATDLKVLREKEEKKANTGIM